MSFCGACGQEATNDARFCSECGSSLDLWRPAPRVGAADIPAPLDDAVHSAAPPEDAPDYLAPRQAAPGYSEGAFSDAPTSVEDGRPYAEIENLESLKAASRRRFRRPVALTSIVGVVALTTVALGLIIHGSGGNPRETSAQMPGTFTSAASPSLPRPLWTVDTNGQVPSPQADSNLTVVGTSGSNDGQFIFRAFNTSNGKELWHLPGTGSFAEGAAVLTPQSVFFPESASSGDLVVAASRATGAVTWQRDVGSIIRGDLALSGQVLAAPTDNAVVALDAATGQSLWRAPLQLGSPSPIVTDAANTGLLYVLDGKWLQIGTGSVTVDYRELLALEPQTGKPAWSFAPGGQLLGSPAVTDRGVFVSEKGGIVHWLDRYSGREQGRFSVDRSDTGTPALIGDRLVVRAANVPASTAEMPFPASTDPVIVGFDVPSQKEVWRYTSDVPITTEPVGRGGTTYFGEGASLVAIDVGSGRAVWKFKLAGNSQRLLLRGRNLFISRGGQDFSSQFVDTLLL